MTDDRSPYNMKNSEEPCQTGKMIALEGTLSGAISYRVRIMTEYENFGDIYTEQTFKISSKEPIQEQLQEICYSFNKNSVMYGLGVAELEKGDGTKPFVYKMTLYYTDEPYCGKADPCPLREGIMIEALPDEVDEEDEAEGVLSC
jgi:hypothetical protein